MKVVTEVVQETPITSGRLLTIALLSLTVIGIAGCLVLAAPFIPAFTWAIALSVVASPAHAWISRHLSSPSLAAFLACTLVAAVILTPTITIMFQAAGQASQVISAIPSETETRARVEAIVAANPKIARIAYTARSHFDWNKQLETFRQNLEARVGEAFQNVASTVVNTFIALFILFFFFRDRQQALGLVRFLLPLSSREANYVIKRTSEIIQGTLYGNLLVAAIQGSLGGTMFWFLGFKGSLLWGVLMAFLSIIPMLGSFVIWIPAAIFLALHGDWTRALILAAWGVLVVGTIDNVLYPVLVGKNTQMHTIPLFVVTVGGLSVMGAAGIILGPVILVLTWSLLEVLRKRDERQDGVVESIT